MPMSHKSVMDWAHRENQHQNYLLYLSVLKILPPTIPSNFGKTLIARLASVIVQFYVTAFLTSVCPSWNEPIGFDAIPFDSF
jgi:hypothetical protein